MSFVETTADNCLQTKKGGPLYVCTKFFSRKHLLRISWPTCTMYRVKFTPTCFRIYYSTHLAFISLSTDTAKRHFLRHSEKFFAFAEYFLFPVWSGLFSFLNYRNFLPSYYNFWQFRALGCQNGFTFVYGNAAYFLCEINQCLSK